MQINILRSVAQAGEAKGLAVIIDVFRAFTTEAYMFEKGAEKIIPVLNLDEAYKLKLENPDYILIGEREGIKPEGFDFGNSPTEILQANLEGRTIVHTTSNGTKGLMNAVNAEEILVGSFVMAEAIIRCIKNSGHQEISLVATAPDTQTENEDLAFSEYVKIKLEGGGYTKEKIKEVLQKTSAYKYLFTEINVPESDFDLCLDLDRFNFVIKKFVDENGQTYLKKVDL
jgi:2-phosphosulfolactate phosphatase